RPSMATFNSVLEKSNGGHVLTDSSRFIRELPSGLRFYTFATSGGWLCLVSVHPPYTSTATGVAACGESLSQSHPITVVRERHNPEYPGDNFGLALDGVTAVSFEAGGTDTTVPVTNNVWSYEGPADIS